MNTRTLAQTPEELLAILSSDNAGIAPRAAPNANLQKAREKFPQYKDVPDATLVDALHRKFYSKRDRSEVFSAFGVNPLDVEDKDGYARTADGQRVDRTYAPFETMNGDGVRIIERFPDADRSVGGALRHGSDVLLDGVGSGLGWLGLPGKEAMQGLLERDPNYRPATEGLSAFDPTTWGTLPRAIVEQLPQLAAGGAAGKAGQIAGRAAGALMGSAAPLASSAGAFAGASVPGSLQVYGNTLDNIQQANGTVTDEDRSVAAATAALSGALDALGIGRVFQRGAGGLVERAARGAGAESLTETGQSGIEQFGSTLTTAGGPRVSIEQALTEGAIGGGAGGVMSLASEGGARAGEALREAFRDSGVDLRPDQEAAAARLAARLTRAEQELDADLRDVDPNSAHGARAVLDHVHTKIAEEIKAVAADLRPQLDPRFAESFDDTIARAAMSAAQRGGKNKVKDLVSPEDIRAIRGAVGDTQQGERLAALLEESSLRSALHRGGLGAGISGWLDKQGFGDIGNYIPGNRSAGPATVAAILGTAGAMTSGPVGAALGAVPFAVTAAARGVDNLRGVRSRVDRFRNQNENEDALVGYEQSVQGLRDVRAEEVQAQRDAEADRARSIMEQELALQRRETSTRDRRAQRIRANDPGLRGFDRSIYDQTGLRPQEVQSGLERLLQRGQLTTEELRAFNADPISLMDGNVGNSILDMLNAQADQGLLNRDPNWNPNPPQPPGPPGAGADPFDLARYQAGADRNVQANLAARDRIAQSGLDPTSAEIISSAVEAMGATNNRQEAGTLAAQAIQAVEATGDTRAADMARAELLPLIQNYRHETRADAIANRRSMQQPSQPQQAQNVPDRGRMEAQQAQMEEQRRRQEALRGRSPEGMVPNAPPMEAALAPKPGKVPGNEDVRGLVDEYTASRGDQAVPHLNRVLEPDEGYLRRVADFMQTAPLNDLDNPKTRRSYEALARETKEQYLRLKEAGYTFIPHRGEGDPYGSSSARSMADLRDNKRHIYFPTDNGFGSGGQDYSTHPLMQDSGITADDGSPMVYNDLFRVVHEVMSHAPLGLQFGPKGEYNAFQAHARMFSPEAIPALAAETLAQNAWVNYGPHLRRPDGTIPQRGEPDFVEQRDRPFADQKTFAFPEELLAADPNRESIVPARENRQRQLTQNDQFAEMQRRQQAGRSAPMEMMLQPQQQQQARADGRKTAPPMEAALPPPDAQTPSRKVSKQTAAKLTPEEKEAIKLASKVPNIGETLQWLTPEERARVTSRNVDSFVGILNALPSAEEMASVAFSGRAKRGWYANSAKALMDIFGPQDAPRFAALLAALSPQCSVESNALNAIRTWTNWNRAGRPTDVAAIRKIMGDSVQGNKGEDSILDAWKNNSYRALTAESFDDFSLSGPKVNSFYLNLTGVLSEFTNDAWMANYAGVDQESFSGARRETDVDTFGPIARKKPGYLAMNSRGRQAAEILSRATGEQWTPAEVQETVWSFAKTLYELAEADPDGRATTELLKGGQLTHAMIKSTPDFATLFTEGVLSEILSEGGYSAAIERLRNPQGSQGADRRADVPGRVFDEEDLSRAPASYVAHVEAAAERLQRLLEGRRAERRTNRS